MTAMQKVSLVGADCVIPQIRYDGATDEQKMSRLTDWLVLTVPTALINLASATT